MTLLTETLEFLAHHGKTPSDVRWVGLNQRPWPPEKPEPIPIGLWEDFERIADFSYDAGYGSNEINSSLVVVGDDWWLERGEYDGSEWWEFKTLLRRPIRSKPLTLEDIRS